MSRYDDAFHFRMSSSCPAPICALLTHAWDHKARELKALIADKNTPEAHASCRDPETLETPLHAAIRSCAWPEGVDLNKAPDQSSIISVEETIQELFLAGAIWNDVDDHNETPGCVAHRIGAMKAYKMCVEAGVRAEMLFGLMDGYEQLSSGDEEEDDNNDSDDDDGEVVNLTDIEKEKEVQGNGADVGGDGEDAPELVLVDGQGNMHDVREDAPSDESKKYLSSSLTFTDSKLVDSSGNGVMMAWETHIMRRTVDALLPNLAEGKRILNIGFGMGIIDGMFAETHPSKHHIIEAHPHVLSRISQPGSKFGPEWERSGGEDRGSKNYMVHAGRWQDVVPRLIEAGHIYDAIYFDTFGEDYRELRHFFTEHVPGLLEGDGIFGFFNGLGADRKICYDVYTKVAELHLSDAGLDVDWQVIDVDLTGLDKEGKGQWEGVMRRYWTLPQYCLPVCIFLG